MVIAPREGRRDAVAVDGELDPRDLGPRGVVADERDGRDAVAHEGVDLHKPVRGRAVAEEDPYVRLRPAELGPEREAGADAKRAEGAGVEPRQRLSRADD